MHFPFNIYVLTYYERGTELRVQTCLKYGAVLELMATLGIQYHQSTLQVRHPTDPVLDLVSSQEGTPRGYGPVRGFGVCLQGAHRIHSLQQTLNLSW